MNKSLEEAQGIFLDRVNHICNKFGLNNIMAQLYAVLYFSDKPLSLTELTERLKISKGSASVNIRALERYGAVRPVWVKGSRKDYYEAEFDVAKVILDRIRSMASGRLSEVDEMIHSCDTALESSGEEGAKDDAVRAFREKVDRLRALHAKAQAMFELFNASLASNGFVHSQRGQ